MNSEELEQKAKEIADLFMPMPHGAVIKDGATLAEHILEALCKVSCETEERTIRLNAQALDAAYARGKAAGVLSKLEAVLPSYEDFVEAMLNYQEFPDDFYTWLKTETKIDIV